MRPDQLASLKQELAFHEKNLAFYEKTGDPRAVGTQRRIEFLKGEIAKGTPPAAPEPAAPVAPPSPAAVTPPPAA